MAHNVGKMQIAFQLLGGFHIGDVRLTEGFNSRHQALIAYLALQFPKPVQRSEAAFKLWPDSNEEQALTNLRKALHHIKQFGDFIQADSRTLQLHPDIRLDVADFTAALDSAARAHLANDVETEQTALETASAFYKGDLLPGFYDEWLTPERERLRDMFVHAMDRLIALLETRKHYRDAIKHAQRLLQIDNLREETYRALIRLHALNEDRAAALNVYHACAGVLSKELGVEPNSLTRELYERLLKSDTQPLRANTPARPISIPLVAREQEWKKLLAEWKKTTNGELRTVLLSGEAGIGKTRLAEDILHWASRQGIRTATAACYSAEGQSSFAPVANWLRAMPLQKLDEHFRSELARIVPELRSDTPPQSITESWQRQVFFESMAQGLLSENEPVLLLLDDVQWCDGDTLEWLRYFLRFDQRAKILLLITLRAEELPTNKELELLLLDLRAEGQLTEMELSRLNENQTAELGKHLLGKNFSGAESFSLFRESEGVPLFVVELANAGVRVESVRGVESGAGANEAGASSKGLPPRLRAVLEGRLARLSSPARTVIESAAVIGRAFDFNLLRKVSELDESATVYALDEVWRLRMVRERGGLYDFSHDKLREATLVGISPVRLRWLHQRIGEALEANQTAPEYARMADHFERAGVTVKASDYYIQAAAQAREIFAYAEALEYLKQGILLESNLMMQANLHETRGDMLKMLERREDAFQAYAQAHELSDDTLQKARLNRKQASLISRFDIEIAREHYKQALGEIQLAQGELGYWHEWIEIQFAWIQACYWQQDLKGQDELLAQTKEPVEKYGTLTHKIHYHHHLINSLLVHGGYWMNNEHVEMARENTARALELGNTHMITTEKRTYSMVVYAAEKFEDCESVFREVISLSEKNGDYSSLLIARVYLSLAHRRMKKIEDVRDDTQALELILHKVSKNPQYEAVVLANRAWLAYCDGNLRDAHAHAQTAVEIWNSLTSTYPAYWAALFVLLALSVDGSDVEKSIAYGRALLNPSYQRLRSDVKSALQATLEADLADKELALHLCRDAVEKAKSAGYV